MKLILKGCPRCGGDLVPDRWDLDGQDMSCVQCGYEASASVARGLAVKVMGHSQPRAATLTKERAA